MWDVFMAVNIRTLSQAVSISWKRSKILVKRYLIRFGFDSPPFRDSKMCGRAVVQNFSDFAQNLEICMRKLNFFLPPFLKSVQTQPKKRVFQKFLETFGFGFDPPAP